MNLIQIQENLKDLPTQAIMGYANGSNPQVPPYMALSELNRRKSMEQRSAQQPTQSVKDQLESQVSNPPQLPQGPQGIAQLPGVQGMPQAPQGMPPGMPQGMPAMPQAPQGMADGGLAGLQVPDEMFNYAPGGIVAFAEGEEVPEEDGGGGDSSEGESEAKAKIATLLQGQAAPQSMDDLAKSILRKQMMGETNLPEVMSPAQAREEAIKQRPELAPILNSLPGGAITDLIGKLKERDQASQVRSAENEGRLGLAGLSNALIAAGEATRGHKGMALGEALGGFGKSYGRYTEESVKRSEAQQALQRQYEIETAKLQSDVQSLQRAYANNDVAAIMSYKNAVADRQAKIDGLSASAAAHGIDLGIKEKTLAETTAQHNAQNTMAQAQLEELRRQHEAQRKQWAAESANRAEQLQIAKETRPTVEDKAVSKIMASMPARVKGLESKQKDLEFGSDEWNQIQERIDDLYDQAYRTYNLTPPPRLAKPTPLKPPEKPGFFSSLFGSSAPPQKAVSFDQLPK
jgi:hypothetical protein